MGTFLMPKGWNLLPQFLSHPHSYSERSGLSWGALVLSMRGSKYSRTHSNVSLGIPKGVTQEGGRKTYHRQACWKFGVEIFSLSFMYMSISKVNIFFYFLNHFWFQLKAVNTEAHSSVCIKRNSADFCWIDLSETVDSLYLEQLQNTVSYLSFNHFRGICITQMFPYLPCSTLCSKD